MKPIDPKEPIPRIHPDDKDLPTEEQTTWTIRGLSLRERSHLRNLAAQLVSGGEDGDDDAPQRIVLRSGDVSLWRLRLGLCGVENFPAWEARSNPIDDTMPKISTDAFLETVPDHVREWLSNEIDALYKVTKEDAGKS